MSKQALSLGFVGGAPNSAVGRAHFTACRMDRLWEVRGGCFSRNADANREAGEVYGVEAGRLYGSLEEMVDREDARLDAVAILTPTPAHRQMVTTCLDAGLPVICEKALAMTSDEALEIERQVREQGGFLAVIYNYSGYPIVRELRRMIRNGDLGEILHFHAEMPQEGFLRTDGEGKRPVPQDWRQEDGPVPTLHLDLAVHLHELIHYLTGLDALEVVADQSSRGWIPVVDHATALCRYSGGVQGQFWFSKCSLGHRNGLRIRIYGSKASAEWYQLNPEEIVVSYADGRRAILDRASSGPVAASERYSRFKAGHPAGFNEALANLYGDIHDALIRYRETGIQVSDEVYGAGLAVDGLRWLEAMTRSVQSGRWESVAGCVE